MNFTLSNFSTYDVSTLFSKIQSYVFGAFGNFDVPWYFKIRISRVGFTEWVYDAVFDLFVTESDKRDYLVLHKT